MSNRNIKKSILVADDEPHILRFIEINLGTRGFEVITATTGEEVLDLVKSAKPDIILIDVIMPSMNGLMVLEELRTFSDLPVIAFSASPEKYEDALKSGANEFVPKPFNTDELVIKIKKLLGN